MSLVFADSFYFFALVNNQDKAHTAAVTFSEQADLQILTTVWVITELGDGLARPSTRHIFTNLMDTLDAQSSILPVSQSLFNKGITLYKERGDKAWSLTDCISFAAMQEHKITDALTGDHHFEQAGFKVLLP